ncbi:MAG: hypothetical protein UY28_C0004G0034 [Candidatus Amesbacteria bacterium GW2011_GWB1_48_13]|uniref:Uncharacterized protein n=1 Tax=Candidatus Amesbacteria bacterium GW2011_GWB1_48_13 TaxID=1618362 RepID=A0A0G1UW66_9BACT|nr:MAG: hypothetical protein UY28_C0004G0034 [Candidatus Amesbacteria bacterium GW2011_GWB1_48_13]
MGAYTPGQAKEIPIGDFAPDLPMDTPGIILDAVGARPTIAGFRPLPNLSEFGDALPTKPLGSYLAYYSDETTKLFAATEAGLWRLNGTSWVDAGVFPSSLSHVQFTQFGDDVLCVGSGAVGNKRVLIAAAMGNTFSLIAGSPQNPTVIVAVGGQVLTFVGQTWFSSAAGDDTDWTADVATLAATGTLYDFPGPVIAASSVYRNALAFKKNGILLGQQSGPPFSWTWEPVSNLTGTWGQGCVVRGPSWVAFIGVDNFYMTTGYGPEPIPNNLASWFFRTVNRTYLPDTLSWYDSENSTIYWHFVSKNAALPPTCDMFVSYNVRARRWCVGYLPISSVPYLGTASVALPVPVEANATVLFDGDYKPNRFFTGATSVGAMTLLTGYYGQPGELSQVLRARMKYNTYPTLESLYPFYTNVLGQADSTNASAVVGGDGWHNMLQTGRYHRFRLATEGDCEVTALAIEGRAAGVR